MRLTDWVIAGRLDYERRTPWEHAPIEFEVWQAVGVESEELDAYWSGFNSGGKDAMYKITQEKRQREHYLPTR